MIPRIPLLTLNIILCIVYSFLFLFAGSFIGGFVVGATGITSTSTENTIVGIFTLIAIVIDIIALIKYRKDLFIPKA